MEHFYCNNAAPEILSWLNMLQREWGSFHNPHSVSWPKTGLTSLTMTIMGLKICSYMVHRSILGEHQFSQIFNHLLGTNTFLWPLAKFSCGWPIVCEGSQSWRLQLTELRPWETFNCFSARWNKHTHPARYQQLDARTNHCWPTVSFYDSDLHHKTLGVGGFVDENNNQNRSDRLTSFSFNYLYAEWNNQCWEKKYTMKCFRC